MRSIRITYTPPGNWAVSDPAKFVTVIQENGRIEQTVLTYKGITLHRDEVESDTAKLFDWLSRWQGRIVEVHRYDRTATPVRVEFYDGDERVGAVWKMSWDRKIDKVLLKGIYEVFRSADATYMVSMIRHKVPGK